MTDDLPGWVSWATAHTGLPRPDNAQEYPRQGRQKPPGIMSRELRNSSALTYGNRSYSFRKAGRINLQTHHHFPRRRTGVRPLRSRDGQRPVRRGPRWLLPSDPWSQAWRTWHRIPRSPCTPLPQVRIGGPGLVRAGLRYLIPRVPAGLIVRVRAAVLRRLPPGARLASFAGTRHPCSSDSPCRVHADVGATLVAQAVRPNFIA